MKINELRFDFRRVLGEEVAGEIGSVGAIYFDGRDGRLFHFHYGRVFAVMFEHDDVVVGTQVFLRERHYVGFRDFF